MKMRSKSINGIKMLSAKIPDWLDNTIEFASNAYFSILTDWINQQAI